MTLHHCNQCGGNMEVVTGEEGDFLRCVNSTEQDPHPNKLVNGVPVNKPKYSYLLGSYKNEVTRQP